MLNNDTSEIHWSCFHFSPLQRVVMSPPAFPVYTIGIRGVITRKIEAIQVGIMATVVPPRAMVSLGTICICYIVVVSLLSWKFLTTMNNEGIASSSWDIKTRRELILFTSERWKRNKSKFQPYVCARIWLVKVTSQCFLQTQPRSLQFSLPSSLSGTLGTRVSQSMFAKSRNRAAKLLTNGHHNVITLSKAKGKKLLYLLSFYNLTFMTFYPEMWLKDE